MRFAVLLCACVLVALDGAQAAFAHARLVRSVPADRAVLPVAPRAVRVLFDNSVVPAAGIAAVRNGGGSVLAGKPRLAPGNRRELVIPLRPNLPRGDYSVRWRIMSDDGHLIAGVLAFAVGSGRAPPTSTLQAGGTGPSALDVFFRWLFLGGLLLAAGTGAFALAVWRPQVRGPLGHTRFAALLLFGCSFVVVGGIGELHGVSTATRFAIVTLVGAVYAGAVAALSAISFVERRLLLVGQAAAVPLALVPTLAGHALDPGRSWIEPVADVLHVSSAAVWLGGLVSLFAVVPSLQQEGARTAVVRRFSALAVGAVALLAVTGLVRALSELTSFHQLWTIGYGRAILVKTGLLGALLALAWLNRYRLLPRLPDRSSMRRLHRSVGAEVVVIGGLVVAVAFLVQLRPGRDTVAAARNPTPAIDLRPPPPPAPGSLVLAHQAGSLAVALAVSPATPPRLTATVLAPSGEALSGRPVSFQIDSGRALAARRCGRGCYEATAPRGARPRRIEVRIGATLTVFRVPERAPGAATIVRRAGHAFRSLRTLVYLESLSSGPGRRLVTTWRMAAPDRLSYRIRGGASAVVIGRRRWDRTRPGAAWARSTQIPPLRVPQPSWGYVARDAHLLAATRLNGRPVWIVSFANPTIPAWFTAWIDRRDYRTLQLRMTAAAHFMFHRYLEFNEPLRIQPPA